MCGFYTLIWDLYLKQPLSSASVSHYYCLTDICYQTKMITSAYISAVVLIQWSLLYSPQSSDNGEAVNAGGFKSLYIKALYWRIDMSNIIYRSWYLSSVWACGYHYHAEHRNAAAKWHRWKSIIWVSVPLCLLDRRRSFNQLIIHQLIKVKMLC